MFSGASLPSAVPGQQLPPSAGSSALPAMDLEQTLPVQGQLIDHVLF